MDTSSAHVCSRCQQKLFKGIFLIVLTEKGMVLKPLLLLHTKPCVFVTPWLTFNSVPLGIIALLWEVDNHAISYFENWKELTHVVFHLSCAALSYNCEILELNQNLQTWRQLKLGWPVQSALYHVPWISRCCNHVLRLHMLARHVVCHVLLIMLPQCTPGTYQAAKGQLPFEHRGLMCL